MVKTVRCDVYALGSVPATTQSIDGVSPANVEFKPLFISIQSFSLKPELGIDID